MINPLKFHDNLWSIGLASMFNWSVRQQQNGGGNNNTCSDNTSDDITMEDINSQRGVSDSVISSLANLDNSSSNSSRFHFHFPTNLLHRSLPQQTCSSIKEKLMKQAGGKSSFTIDSLLGITNAAHQAIQNCILPQHACRASDKGQYDQVKESRYSPYFNSRKERVPINLGSSSMLASEKCGEKSQKCSRRTAKSKRVRTIFTPEQLERLEAEFERQQYMVGPERLYLASSLYLTEAQVKVWFQNRRIKWRKQHLEMQQQRVAVFRSKQSGMENEDVEDYEEESDSSTSVTLPPSDIPTSSALMTTFSGSLLQDSLNCPNKDVLSELNLSHATNSFTSARKSIPTPSDSSMYSNHSDHCIVSK